MAWCEPPATSLASIPDSTRQEQSGVLSGFVAISACVKKIILVYSMKGMMGFAKVVG